MAKRRGAQEPTFETTVPYAYTDGPECVAMFRDYGIDFIPAQEHEMDAMLARDANGDPAALTVVVSKARQNGKMLSEWTDIPTPDGWKKLRDVNVGDKVFGPDGSPTTVVAKYEPSEDNYYEVDFGNAGNYVNETVRAGGGHLWEVDTCRWPRPKIVDTDWLYENLDAIRTQKQSLSVRMAHPVEYERKDLPIDPYLLGVWLGDGCALNGRITSHKDDAGHYMERFAAKGFEPCFKLKAGNETCGTVFLRGFRRVLAENGLVQNKHIPEVYLTASIDQRMELLRGLMDTDGHAEKQSGRVSFCQSGRPEFVKQVQELVASLGMRTCVREKTPPGNMKNCKTPIQEVYFQAQSSDVFSLQRKKDQFDAYNTKPHEFDKWYIKSIRKIEKTERYFCLTVDNPSHLFLCTRSYIPTHNSFSSRLYAAWMAIVEGKNTLYSAHNGKVVRKFFMELLTIFDSPELYPDLAAMVVKIVRQKGEEGIYFDNGAYIEFSTRTDGGARGGSYQVIVIDEAQELTETQLDALLPTASATGSIPQLIYVGTPPNERCLGTVFKRMHDNVHAGKGSDTWWMEWSIEDLPSADATRAQLLEMAYATNPMLGYRIDERTVLNEIDKMSLVGFARERLNWWTPDAGGYERVVTESAWNSCATEVPPVVGKVAYGVKFSPDGARVALAAARRPRVEGAPVHVELVMYRDATHGLSWLYDFLLPRAETASCFWVDGRGRAANVVMNMKAQGAPALYCHEVTAHEYVSACGAFQEGVNSKGLTHYSQQALSDSVTKSSKRHIGDKYSGGFGFGDVPTDADVDPTPAEAAAIAYQAVRASFRDPGDESEVVSW